MTTQSFIDGQRKAVNAVFVLFVGLLAFMWCATLLDQVFGFGWGWDRQLLWFAPPMALFAAFFRFCAMAIFRFVASNF